MAKRLTPLAKVQVAFSRFYLLVGQMTKASRAFLILGMVGSLLTISMCALTESTAPQQQGKNQLYFNSREPGCGTDANVIMCDDFEDGEWYTKDCGSLGSGGLLGQDGWCGTIYNAAGLAAGTARCNGAGFRSDCAATTGTLRGTTGNMADIALKEAVNEVWVRFYTKPLAGYQFGAEKMLSFNAGPVGVGGIRFGNLSWNCGRGAAGATGNITMGFPVPVDVCADNNVSAISIQPGNWYFYEVHYRLSSPGQADGVFELWVDDCGSNGMSCPATPTLRMRYPDDNTRINNARDNSELIRSLWFESWANPESRGERYWDQIKVAKVGPIGFMR